MSSTEKRAFRAPKTGDPREIELAFEYLNRKMDEVTESLDAALAAQESTQEAASSSNTALIESNSAAIATNTSAIADDEESHAAQLATQLAAVTADYEGKVALKVANDVSVADVTGLFGLQAAYYFTSPSGPVDELDWQNTIRGELIGAYGDIVDDINTIAVKVNTICQLIRNA